MVKNLFSKILIFIIFSLLKDNNNVLSKLFISDVNINTTDLYIDQYDEYFSKNLNSSDQRNLMKFQHYYYKHSLKSLQNTSDSCNERTSEILKYFLNPKNSTIKLEDFVGFFLYSSVSLNDFGDYTNCVKNLNFTYILVTIQIQPGIKNRMGLCFFKECEANNFNNSKNKIIDLINVKYALNISQNNIDFSNPKENLEIFKQKFYSGFIISTIVMGLIAFLSLIKFFMRFKYSKAIAGNNEYQKLNETQTINETCEINKNKNAIQSNITNQNSSWGDEEKNCKKYKLSNFSKFLDNFDIIKNTNSIINVENNNNKTFEYLRIFDGVRCLSTCWVLWGHVFFISFNIGYKNFYDIISKSELTIYSILTSSFVSVDVFFYISGFLLYFNLTKYINKAKNKIVFFISLLFQRYIRLLPFYFIAIFYITYLLPYIIKGGKTDLLFNYMESCPKYWWANILYIQNHIDYSDNAGQTCVGHSWYLGDDMIYFIITTIILLIIQNKKIIQNIIILFIFIGSIIWQYVKIFENNYTNNFKKMGQMKNDYFFNFYIQPFARITPYMLGIFYCELFFETDIYKNPNQNEIKNFDKSLETENLTTDNENQNRSDTINNSKIRRFNLYLKSNDTLCYVIFIISLIFINYSVFINKFNQTEDFSLKTEAFLITFNKVIFIIGLGNIIHLTFLEKFSFIKNFLSAKIFTQFSRLTYGVYILHYYVIIVFFYNSDSAIYMDLLEFSFYAIGLMIITLILSFIIGILYESPIINMLKYLKKNEQKNSKNDYINSFQKINNNRISKTNDL